MCVVSQACKVCALYVFGIFCESESKVQIMSCSKSFITITDHISLNPVCNQVWNKTVIVSLPGFDEQRVIAITRSIDYVRTTVLEDRKLADRDDVCYIGHKDDISIHIKDNGTHDNLADFYLSIYTFDFNWTALFAWKTSTAWLYSEWNILFNAVILICKIMINDARHNFSYLSSPHIVAGM